MAKALCYSSNNEINIHLYIKKITTVSHTCYTLQQVTMVCTFMILMTSYRIYLWYVNMLVESYTIRHISGNGMPEVECANQKTKLVKVGFRCVPSKLVRVIPIWNQAFSQEGDTIWKFPVIFFYEMWNIIQFIFGDNIIGARSNYLPIMCNWSTFREWSRTPP